VFIDISVERGAGVVCWVTGVILAVLPKWTQMMSL
jgi:hypothetical protein